MKRTAFLLALGLFAIKAHAQIPIETGFFLGTTTYQGDLAENDIEFNELNFAFGGFLRYHFGYHFKMRGNLIYGKITGTDLNAKGSLHERGWGFNSQIVEMSLLMEYHKFGRKRINEVGLFWRQVSPYLAAGLGVANFDPNIERANVAAYPGNFPEIGAKSSTLTLPVIVGVQFDLNEHWIISVEAGSRFTFNDYLDGVSKNGNPDKNDLFIFTGVSLSYYLGYEENFNLY
ncbi:MAG TPA: hypothetical protein ENJ95_01575 [Bacteroidetes bacterium]|nr:hypothetical protein [Bacteroidota bacterium]